MTLKVDSSEQGRLVPLSPRAGASTASSVKVTKAVGARHFLTALAAAVPVDFNVVSTNKSFTSLPSVVTAPSRKTEKCKDAGRISRLFLVQWNPFIFGQKHFFRR